LSILLCSRVLSLAADVGVPNGWSALQYDNYGNDLLNKQKPVEARKYFDAAIRIEPSRWTARKPSGSIFLELRSALAVFDKEVWKHGTQAQAS
jgi:hypothetical protein